MDWTAEKAREAEETLRRWRRMFGDALEDDWMGEPADEVIEALSNDLNTAQALSELHHLHTAILNAYNEIIAYGSDYSGPSPESLEIKFLSSARLLGLLSPDMGEWSTVPNSVLLSFEKRLVALRAEAMETKNFADVDALKVALLAAGVQVRMSKMGVELVPSAGFDPSKLEALK